MSLPAVTHCETCIIKKTSREKYPGDKTYRTVVHKNDESDKYQIANPISWCTQRELLSLKIADSAPDGGTKSQSKHKIGIAEQQPCLKDND